MRLVVAPILLIFMYKGIAAVLRGGIIFGMAAVPPYTGINRLTSLYRFWYNLYYEDYFYSSWRYD